MSFTFYLNANSFYTLAAQGYSLTRNAKNNNFFNTFTNYQQTILPIVDNCVSRFETSDSPGFQREKTSEYITGFPNNPFFPTRCRSMLPEKIPGNPGIFSGACNRKKTIPFPSFPPTRTSSPQKEHRTGLPNNREPLSSRNSYTRRYRRNDRTPKAAMRLPR